MRNAAAAQATLVCLLLASLAAASPAIASPAWLPPTDLSAPGHDASEPVVAMDEAGETVVVWQRQSESEIGEVVQASTRSPGAAFSAPFELSAAAGEPTVAMTPSGDAVAVWRHFFQEEAKGYYAIQASYRPPGGSFSAPVDIAVTPSTALPQDFHVAIDAAGDTAVVWTQQESGPTSVVEASMRPAGGGFTTPVTISTTPFVSGQSARNPRVAIDAAGEAAAVWIYENGSNDVIQTASGTATGGFSSPFELSAAGQEATSPAIAMSPAGEATAVWTRSNGTTYVVEAATASPGGSFSAPLELSNPAGSALEPEVATDPSGAQTAVWTRSNGAGFVVEAASGAGGGFGPPTPLSEPGAEATRPQVTETRGGSAAIVWQRSNGTNEIVQAAVGSAGNFGASANLSTAGQDSRFPMVAVDGEGDATAVWRSDGTSKIIQAAGYDADAPQLRDLSIPSQGTVGTPVSFSASPFDVWPIASTTFDFGDGSTAAGPAVSHTYREPGVYRVTVTARDAAGTAVTGQGTIAIRPSNEFSIRRLSRNRRRGTATFAVSVLGPGTLVLSGKRVKRATRRPTRPATVKLPIVARGKALRKLKRLGGVVHVGLAIAFTPNGGDGRVKRKTVTLVRKVH